MVADQWLQERSGSESGRDPRLVGIHGPGPACLGTEHPVSNNVTAEASVKLQVRQRKKNYHHRTSIAKKTVGIISSVSATTTARHYTFHPYHGLRFLSTLPILTLNSIMPAESHPPPPDYSAIRRIRIHRKRTRLRTLKRILTRLLLFLFLTGTLIDVLHPRSLHPTDPTSPLSLPAHLPPPKVHLTPLVVLRTTVHWTPVETLSLLHLPPISANKPALFAASPVSRTFYPWKRTAFIVSVKHGAAMPTPLNLTQQQVIHIPRFASFSIHTNGKEATLVEYADGLSTAAALHAAFVAAFTVGDPSLPLHALLSELRHVAKYLSLGKGAWPRMGSNGWSVWGGGLGALRQFADRKRSARAEARTAAGTTPLEGEDVL